MICVLKPFVSHIKSKIRKQQLEMEKEENPRTPAPKRGAVKVEPKAKTKRR